MFVTYRYQFLILNFACMIAETILRIAKDLFGIFTKLDDNRLQRTARIAEYFSNLAQTIEDTSAYLKKGDYPHGECANLRMHADRMVSTIGDIIGNSEAEQYAARVMEIWEIEKMYGELIGINDKEKEKQLHVLDEAAGYFRGVAAHLRVTG